MFMTLIKNIGRLQYAEEYYMYHECKITRFFLAKWFYRLSNFHIVRNRNPDNTTLVCTARVYEAHRDFKAAFFLNNTKETAIDYIKFQMIK